METFTHLKPLTKQASKQPRIFLKAKIFLFMMMLSLASIYNLTAQTTNCVGCTPISTLITLPPIILCPSLTLRDNTIPPPNTFTVPDAVWMQIRYYEVVCGATTAISIYDVTFSTMQYNCDLYNFTPVSGCGMPPATRPYGFIASPFITNTADLDALIKQQIAIHVPMPNGKYIPNAIYFEKGCIEYAIVQWPANARMWVSGGDSASLGHYTNLTTSIVEIPCGEGCCEVELVTGPGGAYGYTYINGTCDNTPPDPNYVPTFTTMDQYGNIVTYTGTIIQTLGACHPFCNDGPPVSAKRSMSVKGEDKSVEIEFSAFPTLVEDIIKFTTSSPILNIEVYSMDGKKLINKAPENDMLNLSTLAKGIYLMRVYFGKNDLRTIKIEKQ
jgi:hypothetical protein